jgi:MFS family permease
MTVETAIQAAALRRRFAAAFGMAALVTPFVSFVLAGHGWRPSELGTALTLLTLAGTVGAPAWGWADARVPGLAGLLVVPATALACVALSCAVLLTPLNRTAVTIALLCFGFCSGAVESLTTAAVARAQQMHALGSLRAAGSCGWIAGLLVGATALAAGAGGGVFAVGALAALIAIPAAASVGRSGLSQLPPAAPAAHAGRPLLPLLLVGLPVPVAAFTMLYFATGWVRASWGDRPFVAVLPLVLAAVLEVPFLLLADRLLRHIRPMTAVMWSLLLLAGAWTAMALHTHLLTLLIVQPAVALMTALWMVGQARAIAARATIQSVGRDLAVAAAAAKAGAAVVAGAGGGAVAARFGLSAVFAAEALLAVISLTCFAILRTKGSDKWSGLA